MCIRDSYHSVEALYAGLEQVEAKPAVLKKLAEGREQARMSYDLAAIRCDCLLYTSRGSARHRHD